MDTLKIKKPVLPPNTLSFKEWRKKHNISTNYKDPKWYSQFKARVELGEDFLVIKKNQHSNTNNTTSFVTELLIAFLVAQLFVMGGLYLAAKVMIDIPEMP